MQASWRAGNSLAQTIFAFLFAHMDGYQALRQRVGLPRHAPSTLDPIVKRRQDAARAAAQAAGVGA
jgi:hypothetical protein